MMDINDQYEIALVFEKERLKRKQRDQVERGIFLQHVSIFCTYVLLGFMTLCVLLPFIWLLSASLKDEFQYFAIPIQWIPHPLMWSNYVEVFTRYHFFHYIFNSLWLAAFSVLVSTFSSAFVAYGFARFRFPGRTLLFLIVLATMMIPAQMYTIPLYIIFRNLGWLDTFLPLLVPQFFGRAFSIFLFRQFFITLSRDIDEAAKIDGSGSLRIFWTVILPQSRPVLIVVALFTFLGSWQDTLGPLVYLNSDANRTIPLGLLFFANPVQPVDPQLMAASLVALTIPVLLYILGQRSIDNGVAILDVN